MSDGISLNFRRVRDISLAPFLFCQQTLFHRTPNQLLISNRCGAENTLRPSRPLRRAAGIVRPRCRMGTLPRPDFCLPAGTGKSAHPTETFLLAARLIRVPALPSVRFTPVSEQRSHGCKAGPRMKGVTGVFSPCSHFTGHVSSPCVRTENLEHLSEQVESMAIREWSGRAIWFREKRAAAVADATAVMFQCRPARGGFKFLVGA